MPSWQNGLDFLVTFVVNSGMREYDATACRQCPTIILNLDGSLTGVPADAFPRKIEFAASTSRDQEPSSKMPLLIAWLIARVKRLETGLTPLESAGIAVLIASISRVLEGLNLLGKKSKFGASRSGNWRLEAPEEGRGAIPGAASSAPTKAKVKRPHPFATSRKHWAIRRAAGAKFRAQLAAPPTNGKSKPPP